MTRSKIRTSGAEGLTLSSTDITTTSGDLLFGTSAKGVNLGVTSNTDSNTIDDYEEGTWTPGFKLGSTACTVTSEGNYTKVGRMVTVNIYMSITNTNSGSGVATVSNFPFAVADGFSNTSVEANGSVSLWYGLATSVNSLSMFAQTSQQGEMQGLTSATSAQTTTLTDSHFDGSCNFRASVTYFTT